MTDEGTIPPDQEDMTEEVQAAHNDGESTEVSGGAEKTDDSAPSSQQSLELPTFDAGEGAAVSEDAKIAFLGDVNLNVKVELGRTRMFVEDVLRLNEGCVVELDKPAGDPVDIYVNDRHVARGEVLVVNDAFCVRISEIVNASDVKTKQAVAAS